MKKIRREKKPLIPSKKEQEGCKITYKSAYQGKGTVK
jgi:hypothetical protein